MERVDLIGVRAQSLNQSESSTGLVQVTRVGKRENMCRANGLRFRTSTTRQRQRLVTDKGSLSTVTSQTIGFVLQFPIVPCLACDLEDLDYTELTHE